MNAAVRERVSIACERFIDSIDPVVICQLASSYNHGKPCSIFEEPIAGSFNICYPVAFSPQSNFEQQKWMVRIPLQPGVVFVDEKLESEIATMRFIAENTRIRVPRVHGYSFQENSPVGFAFMLIDYIDGITLADVNLLSLSQPQRAHLYDQLAEFYIQLRNHEFPHIGSLSISNDASGWSFATPRRPLSIELNSQELEGLQASDIIKKDTIFQSATDYFASLIDLAFNMFKKGKNSVFDEYDAKVALYNLDQFRNIVSEWGSPVHKGGPFILDHGDFGSQNVRVDENLNIVGVIDWEWARIVPAQLFLPPTWLTGKELGTLCKVLEREEYIAELGRFKGIIQDRGEEAAPLLKVWKDVEQDGRFLAASALRYPTFIDTVYSSYFDLRRHRSPLLERVEEFIRSDTRYQDLIQRKVADRRLYLEELRQLGLEEGGAMQLN